MPAPRFITEVAKQVRTQPSSAGAAGWLPGVVETVGSDIGNEYTVTVGGAGTVAARSVTDAPLVAGSLVWTVTSNGETLIVGVQ